jgi:hypothetical protein
MFTRNYNLNEFGDWMNEGWIGVDLDGTLAEYQGSHGPDHIGQIITPMKMRIIKWLGNGTTVKIMTARVSIDPETNAPIVQAWLVKNGLPPLEITCCKDYGMIEQYRLSSTLANVWMENEIH